MAVVESDTFILMHYRSNMLTVQKSKLKFGRQLDWPMLEFILEMPEGFDTQLGDRGFGYLEVNVSALRLLVPCYGSGHPNLDETTSALDSVSGGWSSLENLSVGRTVIVAHQFIYNCRADKVVVLEQGRIVEQGGIKSCLEQRQLWKYHQIHAA